MAAPNVSSMTLTAAATHSAMATAAVTVPALAPMLSQLTPLIAGEILANHVGSARRATRLRSSTALSAVEEQRLRTCSRSSRGSGASGTRPKSAAGRSAPGP